MVQRKESFVVNIIIFLRIPTVDDVQDGTINIHTVRKGLFMQSLSMPRELRDSQLVVKEIVLSNLANIIAYTEERSSTSSQVTHADHRSPG